jgi:hypothetical protein
LEKGDGIFETGGEYIAPETELEQRLVGIWQEILKRERIGVEDNFFDMGGNSLTLIKIHSLLHQQVLPEFSQEVSLTTLFQYHTIRSLAAYLTKEGQSAEGRKGEEETLEENKSGLQETLALIRTIREDEG